MDIDEEFIENMVEAEYDRDIYKKALEKIVQLSKDYAYNMHDEFLKIAKEALK